MALRSKLLENLRLTKTFHFDKGDLSRMSGWWDVYGTIPDHIRAALQSVWGAEKALEIANDTFRRALDDEISALED